MIALYLLAAVGACVVLLMLKAAGARNALTKKHQLTPDQVKAVAIITGFLDAQTGKHFPGRASAIATFVKEQPADWASGVAGGFISPAVAAVTLMYEPEELVADHAAKDPRDLEPLEKQAFWAMNNAWGCFMRGLMPRKLQDKLAVYLRGVDEGRSDSIARDWEAARAELCKWAEAMVDRDCPKGSELSSALRRAQMEPTSKIPSDLDLTYVATGKESPSWIG